MYPYNDVCVFWSQPTLCICFGHKFISITYFGKHMKTLITTKPAAQFEMVDLCLIVEIARTRISSHLSS